MGRATGRKSFIGVGVEGTWGTAVALTAFMHANEVQHGEDTAVVAQPTLYHATLSTNARYSSLGQVTCELSAKLIPTYTNFGLIFRAALGTVSSTGSGPYVHTYKLTTSETTPLTVEVATGDTGSSDIYTGFVASSFEFSVEAGSGNYAYFTVKGLCKKRNARSTSSDLSADAVFSSPTPVLYYQLGALTWNSASYNPKSFKLMGEHGYKRVDELGSQYTAQPVRDDFFAASASMTIEVTAAQYSALYTAFQAGTESDLAYTFTSGSTSIAMNLHNAKITALSRPLSGAGKLSVTATFKGFSDGTDEGVTIVVTNGQATGIAYA